MLEALVFSVMLSMSAVMILEKSPLFLMMSLVGTSLVMGASIVIIAGGVWLSYALILVFLGGMLVIFLYLTSLVPKEKYAGKEVLKKLSTGLMLLFFVIMLKKSGKFESVSVFGDSSEDFFKSLFLLQEGVSYFYLAGVLLVALVVCSNLSSKSQGALQAK
uniref:NADH-ubiquinone oxidoreductase chain 6 n=1 Tax=Portunion sp. TaxID=2932407 RepID=A0A977TPR4_9CRUS|nr:NADH dehydrogenase subunit 6 [Portunion sp.]